MTTEQQKLLCFFFLSSFCTIRSWISPVTEERAGRIDTHDRIFWSNGFPFLFVVIFFSPRMTPKCLGFPLWPPFVASAYTHPSSIRDTLRPVYRHPFSPLLSARAPPSVRALSHQPSYHRRHNFISDLTTSRFELCNMAREWLGPFLRQVIFRQCGHTRRIFCGIPITTTIPVFSGKPQTILDLSRQSFTTSYRIEDVQSVVQRDRHALYKKFEEGMLAARPC